MNKNIINETESILQLLLERYPCLTDIEDKIRSAYDILCDCYKNNGLVLICGNGGSAADSEHIVGELMKGFIKKRALSDEEKTRFGNMLGDDGISIANGLQGALPAISLISQTALTTAFCNDEDPQMLFAQQVYGYSRLGVSIVLIGLSTSGNSPNVVNAVKTASALGIKTVGITGQKTNLMQTLCDVNISLPASQTYQIQELTLPVYHALCAMAEATFF